MKDTHAHTPSDENASPGPRGVAVVAAVAVVLVALGSMASLWVPLALAAWTASLLSPLHHRVTRLVRGHSAVGAVVSVLLVHSLLIPVGVLVALLGSQALVFARQLLASSALRQALEAFVSHSPNNPGAASSVPLSLHSLGAANAQRFAALVTEHGVSAWHVVARAAGAGARAVLALMVYAVALYALLVDGTIAWQWIEAHAPIAPSSARRLAKAFHETGRGIIVGAGLSSLAQSLLAVLLFAALGVPRALVLGALTFVCAFVPAVGTALVWAPVALGLALTGHPGKAAILALTGALGIGSIDNVTRPMFQRWGGSLDLPASLLFFSALGGLRAFGPEGLLLGPLALRMAREVLEISRDARAPEACGTIDPR